MRPRKKVSRTDQSKNNGRTLSFALRLKHEQTSVHEGLYVRILLRADLREVPGGYVQIPGKVECNCVEVIYLSY